MAHTINLLYRNSLLIFYEYVTILNEKKRKEWCAMADVFEVARYLLSLDTDDKYFNKNLACLNGRKFYEGNARLNKMLHLANNVFLVKSDGENLIDTNFYAYDNGAVAPEVQENYSRLLAKKHSSVASTLPEDTKLFLKKMFFALKDAPLEELIGIDHEDPEWQDKHIFTKKLDQLMDSKHYLEDYKERYRDFLNILESMEIA